MSRLEHYAGQDEIGLRYNSHRTKREEYLLMSGDEFMERFSWHVASPFESPWQSHDQRTYFLAAFCPLIC